MNRTMPVKCPANNGNKRPVQKYITPAKPLFAINGDAYDAKLEASCVMPEDYSRDHLNHITFQEDEEIYAW